MEEFKKFCESCKEEKDIIKIEKDNQGETIKLSCCHKIIKVEFFEKVTVIDSLMTEHFDSSQKLLAKDRTKISGKTKRPTRESFDLDRKKRKIFHKVWEQNQNNEWILVHDEEKPFPLKKGKT